MSFAPLHCCGSVFVSLRYVLHVKAGGFGCSPCPALGQMETDSVGFAQIASAVVRLYPRKLPWSSGML